MASIDELDFDKDPGFNDKKVENEIPNIIKVIGVGGGGSNAINHMFTQKIKGVSFVVCNTDMQALHDSPVPEQLLIGPNTTHGLGAGNKPEVAKQAAEESAEDISKLFDEETKMVFITAGMGGGTGTGAAPVVAKIAKEKGVLTVGIVTIPFLFEGEKKIAKALKGSDEMSKYVDALLIINNERLTEIYSDLDFMNAFGKADDTLTTAARSISELITTRGRVNLDFEDVNTTLRDGGVAIISTGYGEGENRVTKAIEDALNSPLLKNRDVYGAKRILVNTYFSENATKKFVMAEIDEIQQFMSKFNPDLDVISGWALDDSLGDKVKITILAAGFNVTLGNETPAKKETKQAKVETEDSITTRLEDEYGREKIQKRAQDMARARYMVLKLEDFDNDEAVDMIEKTPTLNRDPKFREQVNTALQNKDVKPKAQPEKTDSEPHTIKFG
jgi:cell division protein FtsZ